MSVSSSVYCSETTRLLRASPDQQEEDSELKKEQQRQRDKKLVTCSVLFGCVVVGVLFVCISRRAFNDAGGTSFLSQKNVRVHMKGVEESVYMRVDTTEAGRGEVVATETIPWVAGSAITMIQDESQDCWKLKATWSGNWFSALAGDSVRAFSNDATVATCFEVVTMPPSGFAEVKSLQRNEELLSFRVWGTEEWLRLSNAPRDFSTNISNYYLTTSDIIKHASVFHVRSVDLLKGVNLGGWFIPEVWMRPSFFRDTGLGWGGSLCAMRRYNESLAEERMKESLSTWVTESDFQEIHDLGFNSVRLPIGYWNVMDDPYKLFAPKNYKDSMRYVDWCFDMADRYNLSVLLDIHGAPGSQNGIDHSGCSMTPAWTSSHNVDLTLKAIEKVAVRYSDRKSLLGFELLNEPLLGIEENNHDTLEKFYISSYDIIRKHSSSCLVVFNELYPQFYASWKHFAKEPYYYNVVIDYHLYDWQEPYTAEPPERHIQDALDWSSDIEKYSVDHPVIVGEWSMSTGTFVQVGQKFVDACMKSFALTMGHYAWNWKIETGIGFDEWNVQFQSRQVKNGMRIK